MEEQVFDLEKNARSNASYIHAISRCGSKSLNPKTNEIQEAFLTKCGRHEAIAASVYNDFINSRNRRS
jgi:hypothetical protein